MVILSYWEASGEVSKLRYKSLLYFSSKRSYCSDGLDYDDDEEKGRRMIVYVCTVAPLIHGHCFLLLICFFFTLLAC